MGAAQRRLRLRRGLRRRRVLRVRRGLPRVPDAQARVFLRLGKPPQVELWGDHSLGHGRARCLPGVRREDLLAWGKHLGRCRKEVNSRLVLDPRREWHGRHRGCHSPGVRSPLLLRCRECRSLHP